jgi:uncharacterized protein
MLWDKSARSSDVEDRRGARRMGRPAGIGIGTLLTLGLLSVVFKTDLVTPVLVSVDPGARGSLSAPASPVNDPREEEQVRFVSFVLDDAQETWRKIFSQSGRPYQNAKLVLFRDMVSSACGNAPAAAGPFYCPLDGKVYIDLSFYSELKNRFGAKGDFAQAYVLAHEIGHHVQNLLGVHDSVRQLQGRRPGAANQLSVMVELQADCLAGIWAHSTNQRKILEEGDVEEGLNAAAAVGDDRIGRAMGRQIGPESFTHGSSEQRATWFRRGLESGSFEACDTFRGQS